MIFHKLWAAAPWQSQGIDFRTQPRINCFFERSYVAMKNRTLPRRAPGGPGIEPRSTHGAKLAVGTAYSTSSRVWYTLDAGCVTEVYYPTIDTPQIRDLQFLFTDADWE